MFVQQIVLPFHCNSCQNLAFLYQSDNNLNPQVLEYVDASWRKHRCAVIKKAKILDDILLKQLSSFRWGIQNIPFSYNKTEPLKRDIPRMGVIISIPAQTEENQLIKIISLENILIEIKIPPQIEGLSAGMLIDLTNVIRIGRGKFRVKEIKQVLIPEEGDFDTSVDDEYYLLSVSADDQEQLEGFVNRISGMLLKMNSLPCNIIPLPITEVDKTTRYHRQLTLVSQQDLIKNFENITIPESIRIAVKQIKT